MKVMSGLDARFLYSSTPTVHMHTIKVVVVDVSARPEVMSHQLLSDMIEERLHRMPMLHRRVVPAPYGLGNPVIINDPDFDIRNHLRFLRLPAPGDRVQLDQAIGDITGTPLSWDRPLWELTTIEGLEGGQLAFVMKLHHALADGVASVAMMENAFITDPAEAASENTDPEPFPTRRELYRTAASGAAHAFRTMPRVARETVTGLRRSRAIKKNETAELAHPFAGPRTAFNVALSADRTFASLELPMPTVIKAKDAAGVSLNDAFLSLCGGAIRRYLQRLEDLPTASLVTSMPMATRVGRQRLSGNHVDNVFVPLHTDIADPIARARAVSASSAAARRVRDAFGTDLFELRSGLIPAGLHGVMPRLWGLTGLANHLRPPLNLVTSCVRGPRGVMEVDGAVVTALLSCGPILEGIGLNITAWSYVDTLYVSFLGCSASLPDPHRLASDMDLELEQWVAQL